MRLQAQTAKYFSFIFNKTNLLFKPPALLAFSAQIPGNVGYFLKDGGQVYLQWLATDEIRPSADFVWNAFLAGELDAHTLGKELSSLLRLISTYSRTEEVEGLTLGSMNNGTPKSTAFLRIT